MCSSAHSDLSLELLAPARDFECGKAAVDSGADAVYIAGPAFGAREAAGNEMREVARLVRYGRRYGVNVYLTLNTLLYPSEIEAARQLALEAWEAGCAALIIQDSRLLEEGALPPIPLIASTQMDNRTVEQVQQLERLGFARVILARELSLPQIAKISAHTSVALEFFVHGALCVCYSGRCYLSEHLTLAERSANRGACIQACRNRYNLEDASGRVLVRNQHLLSLRDLRLDSHLGALIDSGITSFKIEGRLKNSSYVKNIVAHYRQCLDSVIAERNAGCGGRGVGRASEPNAKQCAEQCAEYAPEQSAGCAAEQNAGRAAEQSAEHASEQCAVQCADSPAASAASAARWRKASLGRIELAFSPNPERTFSRGHTLYNIYNNRSRWATLTHGKARGEEIGAIAPLKKQEASSSHLFTAASGHLFAAASGHLFTAASDHLFTALLHDHIALSVGDGLCWLNPQGEWVGGVVNAASPTSLPNQWMIELQTSYPIGADNTLYRTYDHLFEKALAHPRSARRIIDVEVEVEIGKQSVTLQNCEQHCATLQNWEEHCVTLQNCEQHCATLRAVIPDGPSVLLSIPANGTPARDPEQANLQIRKQLEKTAENLYLFHVTSLKNHPLLFFPTAQINEWRRRLGAALLETGEVREAGEIEETGGAQEAGEAGKIEEAGKASNTLMICKYCVRYEMGLCKNKLPHEPLYLVNQGKKFKLTFDCERCEMRVLTA